jgi:hypothetical protein
VPIAMIESVDGMEIWKKRKQSVPSLKEFALLNGLKVVSFQGSQMLEFFDENGTPRRVMNRIPDDVRARIVTLALDEPEFSPRKLAVRFTDAERYFVSEASVCRLQYRTKRTIPILEHRWSPGCRINVPREDYPPQPHHAIIARNNLRRLR